MIIDFHTHFYPEKIVERALATAREKANIEPALDGRRSSLLASMQQAGIDRSVGLPLVTTPGKGAGIINWAKENDTGAITMLGSVHPRDAEFAETLTLAQAANFPGIKVHPEYQSFSFDETALDPVWQMVSDLDMFLITHAGEDSGFAPPYHSDPMSLRRFHDRFPRLKLVLAHGGSWKQWSEVKEFLAGCNVYFDLAFVGELLEKDQYKALISALGVENCLFGTDSPWCDQAHALELLHDLKLGTGAEEMIHAGNACKLLKNI